MTVKDFQAIVVSSLEEREEITHIWNPSIPFWLVVTTNSVFSLI